MTKYNYLYVEDDPMSRQVMRTLLVDFVGVGSLTIFNSSANFLERVRALDPQPDFFFIDIRVEPQNGYELLKMLRQDPTYQHCRAIAVTAGVMTEEVNRLRTGTFDGALAKPLDMAIFADLIQDLEAGKSVWQIT